MKTQLLQDIVDSGGDSRAAPAGPDPTARLAEAKAGPDRPGAASADPDRPRARPRPAAAGSDAQPESGAPPDLDAPSDFATAPEPDWLAELMRQDAERADARQKAGRLRRRLFGWSIGAGVLALPAAGALWVIEERRVAAPLAVLAESRPAAAVPSFTPQAAPAPALGPVLSLPRPAPTILEEAVRQAAPLSTETSMPGIRREPAALGAGTGAETGTDTGAQTDAAATMAGKTVLKAAAAGAPERTQADRRKREETLLQCRALGYDEGQCIRRECGMTRFGLACRGGVMGADVPP
jgi:hypothetical protein